VQKNTEDDVQYQYYLKLGGSASVSAGFISVGAKGSGKTETVATTEHSTNIKIYAKVRSVQINRPWLEPAVMKLQNYTVPGFGPGSWSTGNLDSKNKGSFPMLSTQLIVAKEIKVTADSFSKEVSDTLKSFNASTQIGFLVSKISNIIP